MSAGVNGLQLDIQEKDSQLLREGLSIPTKEYDAIEIKYRAWNFDHPVTMNGQVFFAKADAPFSEVCMFYLPPLITDGSEQCVVVSFNSLKGGKKAWDECGTIGRVRLDLTDDAPGSAD